MKRPTGVTILGWLAIVFGAIGLIVSIAGAVTAIGLMAVGAGVAGTGSVVGGASLASGAFFILALTVWTGILSLIEIAFGVGALQLRPWAWTLGMIWTWISIVSSVFTMIANRGGIISGLVSILVAVAILYYLYTDEVRTAFGKADKVPPGFMVPVFEQIHKMLGGGGTQPPHQTGGYQPPQAPSGYTGSGPQAPAHYEAPQSTGSAPGGDIPAPPAPPAPPT